MRKSLTLDLNSPIIAYISGIFTVFMFIFYEGYKNSGFFFVAMAMMAFAMLFKFENLFLFCTILYPSLDIIKFGGGGAALFGYYMMVVFAKYALTHKTKINNYIIIHACFGFITAFIYSQTSMITTLVRAVVVVTLFTSMFRNDSKYMNKNYLYKVLISAGMGVVCSSLGILLGFRDMERNYTIVMFSCVAAIILLLTIYTKRSTALSIVQILIIISGIIFTLSRTATISLLAILLIPICLFFVKGKRASVFKIMLIVIVALLFVVLVYSEGIADLIDRFNDENFETGNGRFELWSYYLGKWISTPVRFLFGNGFNSLYIALDQVSAEHSTFIQMISTGGFFGTITLLFTYFQMFKGICSGEERKKFHYFTPLICAMICYFGISSLYSDAFHFTLLIAFLIIKLLSTLNDTKQNAKLIDESR